MLTLRPYNPPTFMTILGALAKVRQLKRKGFPKNLRNWRFVTLTCDPKRYPDPSEAHDICKRHLRELMYQLRKRYGIRRWCWKMEMHEPDEQGRVYAHFHLLLDYKRPIPVADILALWGKGRVDIDGVTDAEFDYLFKYVTKAVDFLPEWLTSRTRVRLFQTSRGFFPTGGAVAEKRPSPRHGLGVPETDTENNGFPSKETIGERLKRWTHCIVSRSLSHQGGKPMHRLHYLEGRTWVDLLIHTANQKFAHQMGELEVSINQHRIETSCLQLFPLSLAASLTGCLS